MHRTLPIIQIRYHLSIHQWTLRRTKSYVRYLRLSGLTLSLPISHGYYSMDAITMSNEAYDENHYSTIVPRNGFKMTNSMNGRRRVTFVQLYFTWQATIVSTMQLCASIIMRRAMRNIETWSYYFMAGDLPEPCNSAPRSKYIWPERCKVLRLVNMIWY